MQPTDIFTELVAETGRRLKPLGLPAREDLNELGIRL